MQEYWVNVYANYNLGAVCVSRDVAELCGDVGFIKTGVEVVYRLHIKMKEKKPKYEERVIYKKGDLIDWMGF